MLRSVGFLAVLFGLLSGCGTTTVSLVVVRPAMLNAHAYGGTVSVVGFAPHGPSTTFVATQLRAELSQRVIDSVGQTVQLLPQGGGLTVSGQVEDYHLGVTEGFRNARCTEKVRVQQDGAWVSRNVEMPCVFKWFDWSARASVLMQVQNPQGQVIFHQRVARSSSGRTFEQRGGTPPPPNPVPILDGLRTEVVDGMAEVIVPHRVRVNATFYDCPKPANAACEAGVKAMARSDYDTALRAFSDAQRMLTDTHAPQEDVAKTFWNRALVYEYSRRFDEATADYRQALALDPCDRYREGLRSVEVERQRHLQLIDQGLGH